MFDKIMTSIGNFTYRYRKAIIVFAAFLFVAVVILQSFAIIEYSYAEDSIVTDIFPQDDTLVVVYENKDEDKIASIIEYLEKDEHVTSISAFANTLGVRLTPEELADMTGIDVVFINTLCYIYENGMYANGMTLTEFVTFITSDEFLNNEMFSSMIDESTKAQLSQFKSLVDAIINKQQLKANQIAEMTGLDIQIVKVIFYIAQLQNINSDNFTGIILGTLSDIFSLSPELLEQWFNIKPVDSLTIEDFISTVSTLVRYVEGMIDQEQLAQLRTFETMIELINSNEPIGPDSLAELFSSVVDNDMFNKDTLTLLYILSRSNTMDMTGKTVPLYDFFMFLADDILSNESFSSFFDEEMAAGFDEYKAMMTDGKKQLVGENHSRFIVTINYEPDSKEIYDFYEGLNQLLDKTLWGDFYLVGQTAMSHEVNLTFSTEYLIISIVTAIAVFIVVWYTFKKFFTALLLVGVIECAIFSMMSVMAITGDPMYFIALILVQCILMGSMIDYAILFTTYYREVRKTFTLKNALPEVMRRSCYAILTSSLILTLVTFLCGQFMTGAVASILITLGVGAFCAILLILFVLPAFLIFFDNRIVDDGAYENE